MGQSFILMSMQFDDIVNALSEDRYEVLKRSVELGKWPDGRILSNEEKGVSLQILIAYDRKHKPQEQRIGYIPPPDKTGCDHDEPVADHSNLIGKG